MAGTQQEKPGLWVERLTDIIMHVIPTLGDDLKGIAKKLLSGQRLTLTDGLLMAHHPSLPAIGMIADSVKVSRYGKQVFLNKNIHINPTNLCTLACKFCAFRKSRGQEGSYELSIAEFMERLDNAAEGIDEVHAVGGLHPDWDITHFVELFRTIKMKYPHIHIKALSAIEVLHLSSLSEIPTTVVLSELKKAGLGSLPGGGAEILNDSIRDIICRGKESSDEYLRIHSEAHGLGIPTNATMLFGTVEGWKERIEHLLTLRETQDKTGGFQCFIPYPFLPDNSRLPVAQLAGAQDILRVIAISRLMLDNIPHLKAYRMNLGDEVTELALGYGADDVDGTVMTEEVMTLAGSQSKPHSDIDKLVHLIENAGGNAVIRDSTYTTFKPIALYHEEE